MNKRIKYAYLSIALVLIILAIFFYINQSQHYLSLSENQSNKKCPENYATDEERNVEYKSFIREFLASNSQGTTADLAQARINFLTKNNCTQTLKYIQDNGGIEQYTKTMMSVLTATDTQATSTDPIGPYYPEDFFSFKYEQDAFKALRNQAIAKLSTSNPIRYCGNYFNSEYGYWGERPDFKPSAVEVFDCKEFGTGNSIIKRIAHSSQEGKGSEGQTVNIKTENSYSLGKYTVMESDIGDTFSDASSSCEITITDGNKEIYHLGSAEYSCGAYGSVEYSGKGLLIFTEPSGGGNDYAGKNYFLLYEGGTLYNLGNFMMSGADLSSTDIWADNGSFIFWGYDGRYEGAFRGSHNASTYAFIPRILKIVTNGGAVQIVEGPAISSSTKQIYQHQLNAIRSSFSGAETNIGSYDLTSLDPFIVYWAGMARYLLSGQSLDSELSKISSTQKLFSLESPANVSDLYLDIKVGGLGGRGTI